MVFSNGLSEWNDLHAELPGAVCEIAQHALAVALLEVVLPGVGVFLALGQHRVDQASELVGGSGDGLAHVYARANMIFTETSAGGAALGCLKYYAPRNILWA